MTGELAGRSFSRGDFNRFFWAKYGVLLRAGVDRSQRRPDYANPAVMAAIAAGYRALPSPGGSGIPRNIFMLWQQGWDAAPRMVQACADSWRRHNPGWTLHLLDAETLPAMAPSWDAFRLPANGRPAQSNIARLALLKAHGGVWADATLFCTKPLDDWLPATELFSFSRPRPYRYLDIWFLAATAGSPALAAWHEMVQQYWSHFRRPHHYYWMEYLFEFLCAEDPTAAHAWEAMPKYSALGPLAIPNIAFEPATPAIRELIGENVFPAHKLTHKWRHAGTLDGTALGALTGWSTL